ncbi:MAG: cytochrome c3 family protein [Geothrix sp.]|nr:cytochrome c3 family protein [Geothrix sp.]
MKSLLVVLLAAGSMSLGAQILGTKHDLSATGSGARTNTTQTCVFCHTPHGSAAVASQIVPLWNKTTTVTTGFTMYNTTNNPGSSLQGVVDATPTGASMACFTCHDGTQAVGNMINLPNDIVSLTYTAAGGVNATGFIASGSALLGKDLTNDHPISITYPATDTGLVAKATVLGLANSVKLFGTLGSEKVQCASCHNVHSNTLAPFLRVTMSGSALCTACHIK